MTRRLLRSKEVADKLGRSHDWFCRNRDFLYAQKFPRPIFGDCKHGRARYDEGAIDAWLDSKMDPALRPGQQREISHFTKDWTIILEQRLNSPAVAAANARLA